MNALNRTPHCILPLPQTCLPLVFPVLEEDDATICTATNANNFPITFDSSLSFSLSSAHQALLSLEFSRSHPPLCVPSTAAAGFKSSCLLQQKSSTCHKPPFHPFSWLPSTLIPLQRHQVQTIPTLCFQSLLKAVPQPDQAASCPVCKHSESLGRREIVCKHRS